jgi:hypothetical protein
VVIARQLLDHVRLGSLTIPRAAPGADAPLVGHRASDDWGDLIHIEGFSRDCSAWRERASSLSVSTARLLRWARRVTSGAHNVWALSCEG